MSISHQRFSSRLGRSRFVGMAAVAAVGLSACAGSSAGVEGASGADDDFPKSTIQMIVPWSAGGGTDLMSRKLASLAEKTCGVRIIVSNQTGAAGATGHQAMVDADPDGYTIGMATTEVAILEHLGSAGFTPADVQGITQISANPALLAVSGKSSYESFEDLKDALKADEQIRIATNGRGGTWDMAARGLGLELGTPFGEYVPFNGAAEMIPAVLGEHVEALSPSAGELLQQIESDGLRPLAVMSEDRFPALPDVPTLNELGVDWNMASWIGVVAPAGVPEDRLKALDKCFGEAAAMEEFETYMVEQGNGYKTRSAADFDKYMDDEYERFESLIAELYN